MKEITTNGKTILFVEVPEDAYEFRMSLKMTNHLIYRRGETFAGYNAQSENERLKAEREYWKERCLLSEDCLEKSPCDPDITSEQIEAWGTYHRFIKEFGIQPPKQ